MVLAAVREVLSGLLQSASPKVQAARRGQRSRSPLALRPLPVLSRSHESHDGAKDLHLK